MSGPSGTRARRSVMNATPTMSAARSASIAGESAGMSLPPTANTAFNTMIGWPPDCVMSPSLPSAGSE